MVQPTPPDLVKQGVPFLAWLLATVVSTVLSPTWWLLNTALRPWIDLQQFLQDLTSLPGNLKWFSMALLQLKALGPQVLCLQILPILVLCLILNLIYYGCLVRLFDLAMQRVRLIRQRKTGEGLITS